MHWWLPHIMGLDDAGGAWYLWWSGIGADITELAIIGGLISIYRRHNCGVRYCWRIGRHDFTDPGGTVTHRLCRHHHPLYPDRPVTAAHIRDQYHLYLGKQRGKG